MPVHAREGVGHLWLADPGLKMLEIYQLDTAHERPRWLLPGTLEGDATVCLPPFDGAEFPLAKLWG